MDVVASPETIAKRLSMFHSCDLKPKAGLLLVCHQEYLHPATRSVRCSTDASIQND
jgi:hypothetical protein